MLAGIPWVAPGWRARGLDPIPAGNWTLRVEDGAVVLYQRRVHVIAGEVIRIEW